MILDIMQYGYRRNELFQISGIRARYPQFFFMLPNEATPTYFGQWEKVETLNEMGTLTDDVMINILRENPDFETWDSVFGNVVDIFSSD